MSDKSEKAEPALDVDPVAPPVQPHPKQEPARRSDIPLVQWWLDHTDAKVVAILAAAVACVAAFAACVALGVDLQSQFVPLLILVGIGVALTIIVAIRDNAFLFLAWQIFLSALLMLWLLAFVFRSLLGSQLPAYQTSLDCMVRFWETCRHVADAEADGKADIAVVPTAGQTGPAVPEAPTIELTNNPGPRGPESTYHIYVQFAGNIRREDIKGLMQQLYNANWGVQGLSAGGQRTGSADGYLEVRYGTETDRPTAEALADAVFASGRVTAKPAAVLVSGVAPQSLELWIGKDFGVSIRAAKIAMAALADYDGPIDDADDPALIEAIKRYQTSKRLPSDGLIGPATLASILRDKPDLFGAA